MSSALNPANVAPCSLLAAHAPLAAKTGSHREFIGRLPHDVLWDVLDAYTPGPHSAHDLDVLDALRTEYADRHAPISGLERRERKMAYIVQMCG